MARQNAMFLALQFGIPDVDALLESMSAKQFDEWMDFFAIQHQKSQEEAKKLRAGRRL